MINQNMHAVRSPDQCMIQVVGDELEEMVEKYGPVLNVKVSKPVHPGTEAQNRAAHALMQAYYQTGMHSAPEGSTFAEFKIFMKLEYGPCWETKYKGADVRVPKSWADYSKDERREFIDALIAEIHQAGAYAASSKIREIIEGMEGIHEK